MRMNWIQCNSRNSEWGTQIPQWRKTKNFCGSLYRYDGDDDNDDERRRRWWWWWWGGGGGCLVILSTAAKYHQKYPCWGVKYGWGIKIGNFCCQYLVRPIAIRWVRKTNSSPMKSVESRDSREVTLSDIQRFFQLLEIFTRDKWGIRQLRSYYCDRKSSVSNCIVRPPRPVFMTAWKYGGCTATFQLHSCIAL